MNTTKMRTAGACLVAVAEADGVAAISSRQDTVVERHVRVPDVQAVVAGQAVWMGLLVSAAVGAVGILFAEEILQWMGASATVVAELKTTLPLAFTRRRSDFAGKPK